MKRLALLGLAVLLAAPSLRPVPVSFTREQAAQGRFDYYQSCAECHGGDLSGSYGPALAGPDSRTQWETGNYVYSYYSVHMPHGAPGTLSKTEYVDIMAFLYEQHGRPAGRRRLEESAIKADLQPMGGP